MARIELDAFLAYYEDIVVHPTFTHKKRDAIERMWKFLRRKEGVSITARRSSPTCKVQYTHHFTVFQVRLNQLGYMMPYRGQWVVMWCTSIWAYDIHLMVLPLQRGDYADRLSELERTYDKFKIVEP